MPKKFIPGVESDAYSIEVPRSLRCPALELDRQTKLHVLLELRGLRVAATEQKGSRPRRTIRHAGSSALRRCGPHFPLRHLCPIRSAERATLGH